MKYTKIICGKLYDGIHDELFSNMEILVEDKLIKEIGKTVACPEGTEVIDLTHLTVTPGMIDAHVHIPFFDWHDVYMDTIYNSDGYRALAGYHCAEKSLHAGFTTIRSIGWFKESYELDVKRAINEGYLPGARMVVAPHLLGTTGSHGDLTQSVRTNPDLMDWMEHVQYKGTGDGPEFFRAAVRRDKKMGADFIKIMATGGYATPNDDPEDIQMSDAELKAIFDTAKEVHIPVTAHVYGPVLMQKLVNFGIDGMEHGSMMDKETAAMIEAAGTYLVPTFCPYQDCIENDEETMLKKAKPFHDKLHFYQDRMIEGRRIILESKIKLGYGTDFVTIHNNYENGWEYGAWIRSMKMYFNDVDPFRALKAATRTNAEICGVDKFTGTLEVGKCADISGWKKDIYDENFLRSCGFVMKEGKTYEPEDQSETIGGRI